MMGMSEWFVSLVIIAEYLGRVYGETKRQPLYLIRERLGFDGTGVPLIEPPDEASEGHHES